MNSKELQDYYSILTAGGRNNGEKSRALPQGSYRDPAETVEFPQEIERQKRFKKVKKPKKQLSKGR